MTHPTRTTTLFAVAAGLVLGATASAEAAVIHSFSELALTGGSADDIADSGAGNVNNAVIGTDRRLIVTFDIEVTDIGTETDSWVAIGFGFNDDNVSGASELDVIGNDNGTTREAESEFALLLRSVTSNNVSHVATEDGDNTGRVFGGNLAGTPGDDTDGIDGRVRITIDLSPAGIAAGETATVTYEVDNGPDGTFEDTLIDTIDWADGDNHIWFSTRFGTDHAVRNFQLETTVIPEPASLALMGLGGALILVPRRRRGSS